MNTVKKQYRLDDIVSLQGDIKEPKIINHIKSNTRQYPCNGDVTHACVPLWFTCTNYPCTHCKDHCKCDAYCPCDNECGQW